MALINWLGPILNTACVRFGIVWYIYATHKHAEEIQNRSQYSNLTYSDALPIQYHAYRCVGVLLTINFNHNAVAWKDVRHFAWSLLPGATSKNLLVNLPVAGSLVN